MQNISLDKRWVEEEEEEEGVVVVVVVYQQDVYSRREYRRLCSYV